MRISDWSSDVCSSDLVLRVGSGSREGAEESSKGLTILIWNGVASTLFAILTQTRLRVGEASVWFRAGPGATGSAGKLALALMGGGHLVGISERESVWVG